MPCGRTNCGALPTLVNRKCEELFELIKAVMLSLSKHLYRFVAYTHVKR